MMLDEQKLEVIQQITHIQNAQLINEISALLRTEALKNQKPKLRQMGWGKAIFTFIADDFNDCISPDFDEYLPTNEQIAISRL